MDTLLLCCLVIDGIIFFCLSNSDDCVASAVSNVQTGIYQDQVCIIPAMENKVFSNLFESDKKISDPSFGIEMHKPIQTSGIPVNLMDLPQHQTQFIHEGTNYMPQNMPGVQAVTSYYPVYHSVPQQQHLHYLPSQPYPLYYLPVAPAQSYNIPVQHGMVQASCIRSCQPQSQPNSSWMPTQVVLKDVAALHRPVAELTSQQYENIPAGHPGIHVPRSEADTMLAGAQIHHPPQPFDVASGETANYTTKLDDDPVRVQIYKSQPPGPVLPSQYQTMTKATTLHLSEAMAKLHTDNGEQQIRTSEPQ